MATYNPTFLLGDDLEINRMGFGAMRITGPGIWGPPDNIADAIDVLQRTVELGVNFIDTADSYGPNVSEELIAEALYPYPPDLVIGTKGGLTRTGPNQWPVNAHPDHLREALNGSLERLKLDYIDLYQLHRKDANVPFAKSLEFLQQAQEDGLINHIGLSEVSIEDIKEAQLYVEVVSVQNMYSVDNRKWESELKYCEENNIAFIPWYPLGGGVTPAVDMLNHLTTKYGASVHQLALSWLLHHSPNILLIPGTSKVAHLEENVAAASIVLDEEDIKALTSVSTI
ncbi:MAG: oxidoreductase [Sphingobacteriales bacterium]|nr:MAG: oxidoreductase [Sphingobacteriales bacterium]